MLIVNNTDKLKDIMEFNPKESFYTFMCLVRMKDFKEGTPILTGKDKQEILIRTWYIDSEESLDKYLPDMLTIADVLKCRLYMYTDRKSALKTMVNLRNSINEQLDHYMMSDKSFVSVSMLNKLPHSSSCVNESSDKGCRKWMFDIDTKNENVLNKVLELCGDSFEATLESKSGYHVVAKRKFDARNPIDKMREQNNDFKVDVMTNSCVLIAMGE